MSKALLGVGGGILSEEELLWIEIRRKNIDAGPILKTIASGRPRSSRWLFHVLNPKTHRRFTTKNLWRACKSRFNDSAALTRGKRSKLTYLLRAVNKGLDYATLHVYEGLVAINWHRIFDTYVFLKDILFYIASNQLRGVLSVFVEGLLSPISQVAFLDVLELRLRKFKLAGKECLIVYGLLYCLKEALVIQLQCVP